MKIEDQKKLLLLCRKRWARIRNRLGHVWLPSQEWEDIEAEATSRVFLKHGQFDPAKGNLAVWAGVVMERSTWNSLRRVLPDKKYPANKWRTALQLARPIQTRLVDIDGAGDEEVVTVPDIVDSRPGQLYDPEQMQRFCDRLKPLERRVMKLAIQYQKVSEISRRMKVSYGAVVRVRNRLTKLYREFSVQ